MAAEADTSAAVGMLIHAELRVGDSFVLLADTQEGSKHTDPQAASASSILVTRSAEAAQLTSLNIDGAF